MTTGGDNQVLLALGWQVSHGRDVAVLDSCCEVSQSLTALEWVPRGRFAGNSYLGITSGLPDRDAEINP